MIDVIELKRLISEKYIRVQKHPTEELYIYNYSAKCQFESYWTELTMMCRGLILDNNYNIISRPFKKFFNLSEHKGELPKEKFSVTIKMDGSMGVLYPIGNQYYVATRGSFISDQAQKANEILYKKYQHTFNKLNKNYTYLFEIIYRENRIILNYNDIEDLFLLAIIDNNTGMDVDLDYTLGFPVVEQINGITDITKLTEVEKDNEEGFVVLFDSGIRLKIKYLEYLRLHKIITNVSTINIWEYLSQGLDLTPIIDRVPDEFYGFVKVTKKELETKYKEIEDYCIRVYKGYMLDNMLHKNFPSQKEMALYFRKFNHTSILYNMMNNQEYSENIWKKIRPAFSKPFSINGQEDV